MNNQADLMNAVAAAGAAVAQRIGDYADAKYKEANEAGDVAGMEAWKEGGNSLAAMQATGAAVVGGLGTGGIGGAAAGAAGAAITSKSAGKLNELSKSIADSRPTGNADADQMLGNIVANVIATGAGAAVGGVSGATAGSNVDRFNRELHVDKNPYEDERVLAKQLAEKSGGLYTQAQIEDQMRIMGVSTPENGRESGAPTTLIGQAPTDSDARWISAGMTADGQPILTQITVQPDDALQSYIRANSHSASAGDVPSQFTYDVLPSGGSINVTGPFTKFDTSDADFVRNTTADAAGFAATQFDRASALATALAAAGLSIPLVSASAQSIAVWTSVASWAAGGIQQIARPDVGNYAVANGIAQLTGKAIGQYPFAAPVINEAGNLITNSGAAQSAEDWVNTNWPTAIKK